MAGLQFEGDTNYISERQLEFIQSILEERGYNNEKIKIEAVGKAGDNYMANVKRVIVEKDGETFKMIAKIAPLIETLRAMTNTRQVFQNEHVMYTEILPKFSELENSAGLAKNERLKHAACYGTFLEEPNEVILLEDLQVSGFAILDRFQSLTDENVKLILKDFAKLHSLSYALKKQEAETFVAFKNKLVNLWVLMGDAPGIAMFFEQIENQATLFVADEYKHLIKGKLTQMPKFARKVSDIDKMSKYSIIQQGDAWTNNIMFRLEDGKTVESCMIDYQASRVSSPVSDLQYMIFNCTDYVTRAKHYYEWIDYYHSELEKCLANYGLKANFVYPRDQLDADLRSNGKLSFVLSIILSNALIKESADVEIMKETMEKEGVKMEDMLETITTNGHNQETVLKLKTRLEGLVKSFLEFGLL